MQKHALIYVSVLLIYVSVCIDTCICIIDTCICMYGYMYPIVCTHVSVCIYVSTSVHSTVQLF